MVSNYLIFEILYYNNDFNSSHLIMVCLAGFYRYPRIMCNASSFNFVIYGSLWHRKIS